MKTLIFKLIVFVFWLSSCGSGGGAAGALAQVTDTPQCVPATDSENEPKKSKVQKESTDTASAVEPTADTASAAEPANEAPAQVAPTTALKLTADNCVDPQPSDVKEGVSMMKCDGTMMTGTMIIESSLITEATPAPTPTPAVSYSQCSENNQTDCIANATFQAINPATIPAAESHVSCSENNQTGCISTETFKSYNLTGLAASDIRSGVSVAGISGSLVVPTVPANCLADNQIGCVTTASYPSLSPASIPVAESHSACTASNQVGCVTTSTYKSIAQADIPVAESHSDCSSDNQVGCVTTATYKSANLSSLVASNLRSGVQLVGVTGSLEVNGESHTDCSASNQVGCVTTATYKSIAQADMPVAESHSNCTANNQVGCVTTATYQSFNPADMPVAEAHADCTSDGQTGCVATSSFKAVQMSSLTAAVLKAGMTIAGVSGQYPSASYPLTGASSVADLDQATFTAKVKSSSAFEWFAADGTRYEMNGDADITAENIKSGVSVFGTTGTHADLVAPSSWNVRKGIVVNGVTGALPTSCRFGGNGVPASADCSTDNPNVWQDLTTGGCTTGSVTCKYKARDTGLTWFRWSGSRASQASAVSYCAGLAPINGVAWRMPSAAEAAGLIYRQIGSMPTEFKGSGSYACGTWTVDAEPVNNLKIYVDMCNVKVQGSADNSNYGVMCVHD